MRRLLPLLLILLLLGGCAGDRREIMRPSPSPKVSAVPDTLEQDLNVYRSRLSPTAMAAYDRLWTAAGDFSPCEAAEGEDLQDFRQALIALQYDHPETRMYTALSEDGAALRYLCAWAPEAEFDPKTMGEILAETEELADALLEQVDREAAPGEQYLQIATLMARRMEYDHDHAPESSYIYRALKEGLCICEGYADCYTYLCHRAGLWCISIDGIANGVHAWNMVMDEDKLYHVDVTWGDTGRKYKERYFMLTEQEISADHARYSLYDSAQAAMAAGAMRDPSYNNDIWAA